MERNEEEAGDESSVMLYVFLNFIDGMWSDSEQ